MTKPWIPASLFVLFSVFAARYYVCNIKQVCGPRPVQKEQQATGETAGPIVFEWSSDEPVLAENADSVLQEVTSNLRPGMILRITGMYFPDEENNSDFADLGLARASNIRDLLAETVDPQKIRVASAQMDGTKPSGNFNALEFEVAEVDIHKAEVLELPDKTVILFPYGASNKEPNEVIDNYLDKLAEQLKNSHKKVIVTGYTDNVGSASKNKRLGLRRAKNIRDILLKKGVSRKQIITKSKGEADPVATNDTPAGRHQNRRVEIVIQ